MFDSGKKSWSGRLLNGENAIESPISSLSSPIHFHKSCNYIHLATYVHLNGISDEINLVRDKRRNQV